MKMKEPPRGNPPLLLKMGSILLGSHKKRSWRLKWSTSGFKLLFKVEDTYGVLPIIFKIGGPSRM